MKKLLLPILCALAIYGCKEPSDDPMRAFKDLEVIQTENVGPWSWIQMEDWVLNQGDSLCARLFIAPNQFGSCEGAHPSMATSDLVQIASSSNGDTVVVWSYPFGRAKVLDLTSPPDVTLMGEFFVPQSSATGQYLGVHDGYLYGALDSKTIGIFDLSMLSPGNTSMQDSMLVGSITLDGIANTFFGAFQDSIAYVGGNGGHIYVVSIADPTNPRVLSDIQVQFSNGLIAYNWHLYNLGNHNIDIISLANPANPIPVDRIDDVNAHSIRFNENYLYLGIDGALQIYDVSAPSTPVLLRNVNTGEENIHGIYLFGNYVVAYSEKGNYNPSYNRLYLFPNTP